MRSVFANLLVVIAVITGILGIFNFTIQYQLTQPSIYNQALKESGIYPTLTHTVSESVSTGLIGLQKTLIDELVASRVDTETTFTNRVVLTLLNTLIDSQTPRLVETLMERVRFEENVREYSTQAVNSSTAWLRGEVEAGELFDRIPTPEQVIAFREASLSQLLYQLTSRQIGARELPFCTNTTDVRVNLERAVQGNFDQITCTNNQIQPILDVFFSSDLANQALDSAETEVQTRLEASGISKIIDGVYAVVLTVTELKQDALILRSYLELNLRVAYALLLTSLVTLGMAMILKTQKRLKFVIKSLFAIGIVVLTVSLLFAGLMSQFVLYQLGITQLTTFETFLTNSQNLAMLDSLNRIVGYILEHMLDFSQYAGLGLTLISGTLWILYDVITSPKVQATVLSAGKRIGRGIRNVNENAQKKIKSWTSKPEANTNATPKVTTDLQKSGKKKMDKKV